MGISIAEALYNEGAEVVLVSGPSHIPSSPQIKRIDVVSAEQMYKVCLEFQKSADIVVMAAAVADFTPKNPQTQKIKKSGDHLSIDLKPTTDILAYFGKNKPQKQYLTGFALETENESSNAVKKLHTKNLDLIVLNSLNDSGAGFGTKTNKVCLIDKNEKSINIPLMSKKDVAENIVNHIIKNIKR